MPLGDVFPEPDATFLEGKVEELKESHFLVQLLALGRGNISVFWIAFLSGVIVIPIAEEFYFRLILQGYLEKKEKLFRRFIFSKVGIKILPGIFAISVPALLFASLHFRVPEPKLHTLESLVKMMLLTVVIYTISIILSLVYLKIAKNLTLLDLGIDFKKIPQDISTAFCTGLIVVPALLLFFSCLQ
ncbi:MAG: CPBP family glutamic-type intramembrane protease, partial [Thermoguttaceae bacterium]